MADSHTVELGSEGFRIDGQERALVAAQFEPFRHNSLYWRRSLEAIKNAGIDLVSIFICWDFHELERGRFDFTGETNPSRDLQGFLDLCAELDLLVLVRPGPLIDAEWETKGAPRDVMHLERLHPRFLERLREYIDAVCEVLAPRQITQGGPIALLGVDNEILYPYTTPEAQYYVDGDINVPYDEEYNSGELRSWLHDRYDSLDSLNGALGTDFRSWDEIGTPRYREDPVGYCLETFQFINHRVLAFARTCKSMYQEAGMVVPTYTNQKQLLGYIDWVPVAQELDSVGINLHLPRDMPGDRALVANWWYRLHRARFRFMWSAEFQSGWIGLDDVYGFISEEHCEYMPMAGQAAGLRGLNFYMFVERDDWNYAPVNLMGKIRPRRYERFRKAVASYRGVQQIDEHLADVGLLWSIQDHQSIYIERDRDWTTITDHWLLSDEAKEPPAWWASFRQLADEDFDFKIWIPGVTTDPMPQILVYAGLGVASEEFMAALEAAAGRAQAVVAVTPLPRRNLTGRPDATIANAAERIEAAVAHMSIAPDDLVPTLTALGARSFVRSRARGVWTFAYRDEEGAIVLGIWNTNAAPFAGPLWVDRRLFERARTWSVTEPRLGEQKIIDAEGLREFQVELEQHSARVFRFSPA